MQISLKSLNKIAEMICGGNGTGGGFHWKNFPYRSGPTISRFFAEAGLEHGQCLGTRKYWTLEYLEKENVSACSNQNLPADSIIVILRHLLDARTFEESKLERLKAVDDLNEVLKWDHLEIFLDESGCAQVKATTSKASSVGTLFQATRAWTEEERRVQQTFTSFLNSASEDQIIEQLLTPLFQHLGFQRISITGHRDKQLEYGKDLWMKFTLPTRHTLFFGCQVKRDKIDASGRSDANIATILNQINMMLEHPILDTESNRKQLLDHIYIISGGEITKVAKNWLGESLDKSQRRTIIFMDRSELVELLVNNRIQPPKLILAESPDIPF